MANSTTLRHAGVRPSMRTKVGTMAHRHNVASWNVAVVSGCLLVAFIFFMGMVQVSNQVNGLRARISVLQDRQEYLEACGASLLAEWNQATQSKSITFRAQRELGLQLPQSPAMVLVRHYTDHEPSTWQNLFQGLSYGTANAAEIPKSANMVPVKLLVSP